MTRAEKRKHINALKSGKIKAFLDKETGAMILTKPGSTIEQVENEFFKDIPNDVELDVLNKRSQLL